MKVEQVEKAKLVGKAEQAEEADKAREGWTVLLRHWDDEFRGVPYGFPLPVRSAARGAAGQLLQACGLDTRQDSAFDPRSLVGKCVLAKFEISPDGELEIISFEPYKAKAKAEEPA